MVSSHYVKSPHPKKTPDFVKSSTDYCNSLLYGISKHNINRSQRIQNSAARIASAASKYDHETPIFQILYSLPVEQNVVNNLKTHQR